MAFIKSASARQLKGNVFIQGYSDPITGLTRLYGPIFIEEEKDPIALGKAVIDALNECKTGIPDVPPNELGSKNSPMILATGMKS